MPFATPRLIAPELIHGKKFRPDTNSAKELPFLLIKKGEKNCDIKLNGRQYEDLHVSEFLNASAVIGWDLDFSEKGFDLLKDEGKWGMCLRKTECENVEKLFNYILDENPWGKKNPMPGGGKGFG